MEKTMENKQKPIVYACSGCSNLAQMAHDLALNIDRDGIAEMSCISGVIGGVEAFVESSKSTRPVIVIDGCGLACTRSCCEAVGMPVDVFINIADYGLVKGEKEKVLFAESLGVMKKVYQILGEKGFIPVKKLE